MQHTRQGPLTIWELQNRCAGLPSCQLAACSLVQAREPAASIIVIDIPAGLDCTDAINDLPGLIEFERQLGQAVEIASLDVRASRAQFAVR